MKKNRFTAKKSGISQGAILTHLRELSAQLPALWVATYR